MRSSALGCRLPWELVCKQVLELLSEWEESKIEEKARRKPKPVKI